MVTDNINNLPVTTAAYAVAFFLRNIHFTSLITHKCFPGFVTKLEDQNMAWLSLVQLLGVKAFVETTVDRDVRNGIQNLIMVGQH